MSLIMHETGAVPADLACEAKPQRYSSDLPSAVIP